MKYYSEEKTRDLRLALEKKILDWSNVTTKKMFGCPCYQVNKKLFVFLVTNGIVITQLKEEEIETLSKMYKITFFQARKKVVKKWIKLSIEVNDLENIIPYVKRSYENTRNL